MQIIQATITTTKEVGKRLFLKLIDAGKVLLSRYCDFFWILPYTRRQGFGDAKQDWGHVTVRPDAHMFWWLYYTTASVEEYTERPLIVWLQGGPGMPSSGYGVFSEIGPLDVFKQPREHSWTKDFNVLFIDNPVGVGFSYFSNNNTDYASDNDEIARDLVRFMEIFLGDHVEFETVPTYLFGESYGGKMVVDFAYQLNLRIRKEKVNCNLKAIALGDSYISPLHYTLAYAPVAYNLGFIDKTVYDKAMEKTEVFKEHYDAGRYDEAHNLDGDLSYMLGLSMEGVDWYNFVEKSKVGAPPSLWKYRTELTDLLNNEVKSALHIPENIEWDFLSADNYNSLGGDFLKPVTRKIETLLNSTDIKVIVYNGVLDLIVSTAGTAAWVNELSWTKSNEWAETRHTAFSVNNIIEGYEKQVGNLIFYTVLRAGHSVPIDNPVAMDYIIGKFLD